MVFSKEWFLKYQKLLLIFANSWVGRKVLCLSTSDVRKNKIIRILPNSITWKEGKYLKTEFRTNDKFARRLYSAFKPFWHLAHLWDTVLYPKFNLGFDTLIQYPATIGADDPDDGRVYRGPVTEAIATIVAGAGSGTDRAADVLLLRATASSDTYQFLTRGIFCFDTSSIGSGATISAVIFSPFSTGTTPVEGNGATDFTVVTATPNSTSGIVAGDYTQLGTVLLGSKAKAVWSTSAYNDIDLNATGIAAISKTGVTSLGARLGFDGVSGSPTWSSLLDTAYYIYYSNQAGTDNDPKLTVTYTTPAILDLTSKSW